MPGEDIQSWSVTAANNATADTAIDWHEGQTRASVNNSARSMMAAHAKERNLRNGTIGTTGSANAQAFTSGLNYTTTPIGLRATLRITMTNTGPATLNMDGIGAVPIVSQHSTGSISGVPLMPGELLNGAYADFLWNGSNWVLLGAAWGARIGRTDASNPNAGDVGEYRQTDLSSPLTSLAPNQWNGILLATLPPGDWDVSGALYIFNGVGFGWARAAISTAVTPDDQMATVSGGVADFGDWYANIGPRRFNVSSNTNVLVVAYHNFVHTAQNARISARRMS